MKWPSSGQVTTLKKTKLRRKRPRVEVQKESLPGVDVASVRLADLPSDWDIDTSAGKNSAHESKTPPARCFYCREILIADQPGGRNPRHQYEAIPYGQCREAIQARRNESWRCREPLPT